MLISLIAAIDSETRTIGKEGGGLPWRIPEDFKYFKETTMGHPIIMGRTTWEEFESKPLPGRPHIVITRQDDYEISPEVSSQVSVVSSMEQALEKARHFNSEEIFIIGGGKIYELGLPYADRLYLTLVDAGIDGPVKFPAYPDFNKIISSKKSSDENYKYEFLILEKDSK